MRVKENLIDFHLGKQSTCYFLFPLTFLVKLFPQNLNVCVMSSPFIVDGKQSFFFIHKIFHELFFLYSYCITNHHCCLPELNVVNARIEHIFKFMWVRRNGICMWYKNSTFQVGLVRQEFLIDIINSHGIFGWNFVDFSMSHIFLKGFHLYICLNFYNNLLLKTLNPNICKNQHNMFL